MPNTSCRARWLAPAILLALASCGPPPAQARLSALQARLDPPALWRVEALDADGRVSGAIHVCADRTLREGFVRANAEVEGRPCQPMAGGVERPGLYAARCDLDGRRFGLTVNRQGDPDRDFTVTLAFKALDGTGHGARQVRRFRRAGACPVGWIIGDQAHANASAPSFNALAGTWGGE